MIPAALLVVLIPIVAAIPAIVLRRWRSVELGSALIGCGLVIAILAHDPATPLQALGLSIDVDQPLNVLGRVLQVRSSERYPLLLLFICAVLLFACSWSARQGWTYVPVGLGMLALLSTGLMIRPFVFAALAFVAASAFGALMIQAERSGPRSTMGAARYLILYTLALPLFLGAGYVIEQATGITEAAAQLEALAPAITLLIIGFGLLLGALPLFTWVNGVAKDAPPLAMAFIATVANGAAMFLLLEFQQEFAWFTQSAEIRSALHAGALVLLVVASLIGWAQQSFSRVVACALFVEIGGTLLALSTNAPLAIEAVSLGVLARAIGLGLLGIGISALPRHAATDQFDAVRGLGLRQRWLAIAIAIGGFSLIGLPGTLGFAYRWASLQSIGASDVEAMVLLLLATLSVSIGLSRGLLALVERSNKPFIVQANLPRNRGEEIGIIALTVVVFVLGFAPSLMIPLARAVADGYTFYR